MIEKKILVCCGTGTATSVQVANKLQRCFTAVVETIASGLNLSATRGTSATRQCSIRALIPRSRSNRVAFLTGVDEGQLADEIANALKS
jgi:PTS system galactitol-specific IIB component